MDKDLIAQWKKDEQAVFEGWDFGYIKDRSLQEHPEWDYLGQAKELFKDATSVLDIDTGGGEILESLGSFEGKDVTAIESYKPNVEVAKKRLEPLGAKVFYVGTKDDFPLEDDIFDLVVNRHGSLNIPEIVRVLKDGGTFFTQQVASGNSADLTIFFGKEPVMSGNSFDETKKKLQDEGMTITEEAEWEGELHFNDVGALVYYLKAIPWVVPDFSVDEHLPQLEQLQEKVEKEGRISFSSKRFLIRAEK